MSDGLNTSSQYPIREAGRRRRYHSPLRQAQAERTRRAVLDAGRALITERGYARTTMRAIAARADVSVETVYQHFRTKPAMLRTLLDIDLGDQAPLPVAQRDWVRDVLAQPDAPSMLARAAAEITAVYRPLVPLFLAVRAAADADDEAARIWAERKAERLAGMHEFAGHLLATGRVRTGLTAPRAGDRLFVLTSPEIYGVLVLELGWTPSDYTRWLTETLVQQLIGE